MLWGIVMGLGFVLSTPLVQPEQIGFASDVYFVATEAFLAGEDPYAVTAPGTGATFIYPPITLLAFVPHALTGSTLGAFVVQLAINLLSASAIAALVLSMLDRRGVALARIDRLLLVGFVLLSVHSTTVYVMGQVNLQLALAVALGAMLVERGQRESADQGHTLGGAAFAVAAAVKLFPAAAGAWLLGLRDWRAIGGAIGTGLSLTVAGYLLGGHDLFVTFLTAVLPAETKTADFAGGLPPEAMYVTIRRPIAALLPSIDPSLYAPLAVIVIAPLVLASYRTLDTGTGRLMALLATLLGTILVLPFEAFYFALLYVPLVPLLYSLDAGAVRRLLAAGTVLLSTIVSYEPLTRWIEMLSLPDGVETAIVDAMGAVLGFAQPPLLGGLCILLACALWHHDAATAEAGA